MNSVSLIGRLTKDPDVRYTTNTQMAIANFSIAINNGKDKSGNDVVDYPQIRCFGKTAELVERYLAKGRLIGITGRISTGSYEKEGVKHFFTYVIADRVEFLDKASDRPAGDVQEQIDDLPSGFAKIADEDIPF